jgi:hypothetical protein
MLGAALVDGAVIVAQALDVRHHETLGGIGLREARRVEHHIGVSPAEVMATLAAGKAVPRCSRLIVSFKGEKARSASTAFFWKAGMYWPNGSSSKVTSAGVSPPTAMPRKT